MRMQSVNESTVNLGQLVENQGHFMDHLKCINPLKMDYHQSDRFFQQLVPLLKTDKIFSLYFV